MEGRHNGPVARTQPDAGTCCSGLGANFLRATDHALRKSLDDCPSYDRAVAAPSSYAGTYRYYWRQEIGFLRTFIVRDEIPVIVLGQTQQAR